MAQVRPRARHRARGGAGRARRRDRASAGRPPRSAGPSPRSPFSSRPLASNGDLIASVNDPQGRLLWGWTPKWLRRGAERIGLVPGGVWNETTTGTNGVATALAADLGVSVFATEHWLAPFRDWVCYAAPVHAADGSQVGALNLSTKWDHANPLGLTTVTAMAQLVEHELQAVEREWATTRGGPVLHLRLLGRGRATLGDIPLRPVAPPDRDPHHPGRRRARPPSTSSTPSCTATGRWPLRPSRPRSRGCVVSSAATSRRGPTGSRCPAARRRPAPPGAARRGRRRRRR